MLLENSTDDVAHVLGKDIATLLIWNAIRVALPTPSLVLACIFRYGRGRRRIRCLSVASPRSVGLNRRRWMLSYLPGGTLAADLRGSIVAILVLVHVREVSTASFHPAIRVAEWLRSPIRAQRFDSRAREAKVFRYTSSVSPTPVNMVGYFDVVVACLDTDIGNRYLCRT